MKNPRKTLYYDVEKQCVVSGEPIEASNASAHALESAKAEYVAGDIDEGELEARIDSILRTGEDPAHLDPGEKVRRDIVDALDGVDEPKYVSITPDEFWDLWEYLSSQSRFTPPVEGLTVLGVRVVREFDDRDTPRVVECIT